MLAISSRLQNQMAKRKPKFNKHSLNSKSERKPMMRIDYINFIVLKNKSEHQIGKKYCITINIQLLRTVKMAKKINLNPKKSSISTTSRMNFA